ncbi:MAG: hypothetical protein IT445_09310 [Phycisphaeraceae bacterium]|nr:hypothetical protein [Phycisphaeraceae bacterium]
MPGSANVQSIAELLELRAFLLTVADKIRTGVQSANSEVNATASWINHTQPAYWKSQCDRCQRSFHDAAEALRRKKMSPTPTGQPPSALVEQKAMLAAKAKLEHAQQRAAVTKQWKARFEKEAFLYRCGVQPADRLVESIIPKAAAYLEKLVAHLENYTHVSFADADESVADAAAGAEAAVTLPPGAPLIEADKVDDDQQEQQR